MGLPNMGLLMAVDGPDGDGTGVDDEAGPLVGVIIRAGGGVGGMVGSSGTGLGFDSVSKNWKYDK